MCYATQIIQKEQILLNCDLWHRDFAVTTLTDPSLTTHILATYSGLVESTWLTSPQTVVCLHIQTQIVSSIHLKRCFLVIGSTFVVFTNPLKTFLKLLDANFSSTAGL